MEIRWSYDDLDRLVQETRDADPTPGNASDDFGARDTIVGGDYSEVFGYDLAGNRAQKVSGWDSNNDGQISGGEPVDETIIYYYDDNDRLRLEDSSITGNDKSYSYDPNGSQTTMTQGGAITGYLWDLRGRMVGLDANSDNDALDAGDTAYGYDSNGVRVNELTHAATSQATVYLNDAAHPSGYSKTLEQKSGTTVAQAAASTPCTTYVLGLRVEGQQDATGTVWFERDGHGSNRGLIESNGSVSATYNYQAFGEAVGFTAASARTVELFGGDGVFDRKTGWTYHLARWRSGFRFTSMDAWAGDSQDPISLHKYLYANGNPVMGSDPSGHITLPGVVGAVTTGVGTAMEVAGVASEVYGFAKFVVSGYEFIQATYGLMTTDAGNIADLAKYQKMQDNALQGMLTGYLFMAGGALSLWAGGIVKGAGLAMMATGAAATVQFGKNANQYYHTFRHVQAAGLDPGTVQAAVEADLAVAASRVVAGQPFNQTVIVAGQQITYTAYKLADGTINVGRITVP